MQNHPQNIALSMNSFGMLLPERTWTSDSASYRYGFNTQERDDEIYGEGNSTTAEYWQYDARLGRRWNVDPVVKPYESPYAALANNPIWFVDINGADTSHSSSTTANMVNDAITEFNERTGVGRFVSKLLGLGTTKKNPNYKPEIAKIVNDAVNNPEIELHFTDIPPYDLDPNAEGAFYMLSESRFLIYINPNYDENKIGTNPLFEEIFHFDHALRGIAGYFKEEGTSFWYISNDNLLKEEARAKHRVVNLKDYKGGYAVTKYYHTNQIRYQITSYGAMLDKTEEEILIFISTNKGNLHTIEVSIYDPNTRSWKLKQKIVVTHPQEGAYQHLVE